jgi:pyruvate kinase
MSAMPTHAAAAPDITAPHRVSHRRAPCDQLLDRLTRTKMIATLGPASASPEMIAALIDEGVDVFRLNMAHGSPEEHQRTLDDIRRISAKVDVPIGVLVDLAGPKIRLGQLAEDPTELIAGSEVMFMTGPGPAAAHVLPCPFEPLVTALNAGDNVLLSDGTVRLKVERRDAGGAVCLVVEGGTVRSRQGVHAPHTVLNVEPLGPIDRQRAEWAAAAGADFVSLSFVRRPSDLEPLRRLLVTHQKPPLIVAKIEKRQALDHIESIVRAADAVMVARGDLGIEIDIEKTPLAQKRIIRLCQQWGKPVIVATQMLESMHTQSRPTRAEASDVANAILDGADACMLSGETAVGQHPLEAVRTMRKIMFETEQFFAGRPSRAASSDVLMHQGISEAVLAGAAVIAQRVQARMLVLATVDGRSALAKSKQRDFIPTVALADESATLRRMGLLWGITPIRFAADANQPLAGQFFAWWRRHDASLSSQDRVVFVVEPGWNATEQNTVLVAAVP